MSAQSVGNRLFVHFESREDANAAARDRTPILDALRCRVTWQSEFVPGLTIVELEDPTISDAARAVLPLISGVERVEADAIIRPLAPEPNEFALWPSQRWYLERTCFYTGGWSFSIDPPVLIAHLDSGVALSVTDLTLNIERNLGEIPGNNVDDDGNGVVDDFWGTEFLNEPGPPGGNSSWPNPTDLTGHGSQTFSVLAAYGDNGQGLCGALWRAHVVPVKVLGALHTQSSLASNAVKAIEYGLKRGCKVFNCSWYTETDLVALRKSIYNSNALFVAAAGNDTFDLDSPTRCHNMYPQMYTYSNIIVVGGSDEADRPYGEIHPCDEPLHGTNWGVQSVDLFAPAKPISAIFYNGVVTENQEGTSLAAPLVSAAAALVWTQHPSWSATNVRRRLLDYVDVIPDLQGLCVTGGRLNVAAALGVPCQ